MTHPLSILFRETSLGVHSIVKPLVSFPFLRSSLPFNPSFSLCIILLSSGQYSRLPPSLIDNWNESTVPHSLSFSNCLSLSLFSDLLHAFLYWSSLMVSPTSPSLWPSIIYLSALSSLYSTHCPIIASPSSLSSPQIEGWFDQSRGLIRVFGTFVSCTHLSPTSD